MIQKLLIAFILILTTILIGLILFRDSPPPPVASEAIEELSEKLEIKEEPKKEQVIPPVITKLINNNSQISSFGSDLKATIWEDGSRFKLSGRIDYSKAQGFRMGIHSIFGEELDLGCNNKVFWYWSRQDKNPALYWAIHEDFNKTRLKTPFNPVFMKGTLGFDIPDIKDAIIKENDQNIILTYPQKDSMGRSIFYSILVDKTSEKIKGYLITNTKNKKLVVCDIRWSGNYPYEILYTWNEENRTMLLAFKKPKSNINLNNRLWVMPNYYPRVDMGKD